VEGEFDKDIVVRINAPALLDTELAKLRERGIVFIGSGVSDAYQPPERDELLMQACAVVLERRSMPVTLLTKSALALRDIDTWTRLNAKAGVLMMMSITTLDDRLREIFEPTASPVNERLATLAEFKARGIPIGVAAMPLLPFLADSESDLTMLATELRRIGVDFVLPGGLTLRPGRQKAVFFETLSRSYPELAGSYAELYAEDRASGAPLSDYARRFRRRVASAFRSASLPTLVPHRLYRDRLPTYDEVHVLLHQMCDLYQDRPVAVGRLRAALGRYTAWLQERKTVFNRRRRLRQSDIEAELRGLAEGRGLASLLDNERLSAFLRQVIVDRSVFDPLERELL